MRIIIRHCSAWGNFATHGIDIEPETDISTLNNSLAEKFDIPAKSQILVFKRDGVTVDKLYLIKSPYTSLDQAASWVPFSSLRCQG